MVRLFHLPSAVARDPAVEAWFAVPPPHLRALVLPWYARMRACGPDVRELVHDGLPTACVGDAAFAYVGAFARHASVGFFVGSELSDPAGLLEGTGRFMRHVKIHPGRSLDEAALEALIRSACRLVREAASSA